MVSSAAGFASASGTRGDPSLHQMIAPVVCLAVSHPPRRLRRDIGKPAARQIGHGLSGARIVDEAQGHERLPAGVNGEARGRRPCREGADRRGGMQAPGDGREACVPGDRIGIPSSRQ